VLKLLIRYDDIVGCWLKMMATGEVIRGVYMNSKSNGTDTTVCLESFNLSAYKLSAETRKLLKKSKEAQELSQKTEVFFRGPVPFEVIKNS
jgi:hypothetical protein